MDNPETNVDERKNTNKPSRARRVAYVVGWLVIWPLIIGANGAILLGALFVLLGEFVSESYLMGIFFAAICIICLLLTKLYQRSKRAFGRTGAKVLGVYTWLGVLTIIGTYTVGLESLSRTTTQQGENVSVAATPFVPPLDRTATIDDTLRHIGATDEEIYKFSTKYVDTFEKLSIENPHGQYWTYNSALDGTFSYGELTVKAGLNQQEEVTVIAHEYLHHIWFAKLDEQAKNNLTSHLITMYGRDSGMQRRVASYSDNGVLQPTELFSYYCTESTDGWLTQYVLDQCNQYINRSALVLQR